MKKEHSELLLGDLCGRLPYGVKVRYSSYKEFITCKLHSVNPTFNIVDLWTKDACFNSVVVDKIKPYLFPLSSMTEEQYDEFFSYYHNIEIAEVKASGNYLKAAYIGDNAKYHWLNKHHFDYRGLIEKGLAIDATNLNIY